MSEHHVFGLSLQVSNHQKEKTYWQRVLAGAPILSQFAPDRFVGPTHSELCADVRLLIPHADVPALCALDVQELYAWLVASTQLLVGLHQGTDERVVWMPRNTGAVRADDHFPAYLPLRFDSTNDDTMHAVQARAVQTIEEAIAHQNLPCEEWETLWGELTGRSELPVASVVILIEGLHAMDQQADQAAALVFHWDVIETGICLQMRYQPHRYHRATVEQIADACAKLLQAVWREPNRLLRDLDLVDESEKQRLVQEWNQTDVAVDLTRTIPQLVADQAKRTPDRIALTTEHGAWTFAELNEQVNRLAHHMLERVDLQTDDRVGLLLDHDERLVQAMLAVQKAGAAYVPLDPQYPEDRIRYCIEDSGMRVLITTKDLAERFVAQGLVILVLDEENGEIARRAADEPLVHTASTDLAYVIYTSGSTGAPKGVKVEQRNVLNFFQAMDARIPLQADDRLLAVTSCSFDISVLELLWTLSRGVEVVMHPNDDRKYSDFDRYVGDHPITLMQSTPSRWKMIVEDEHSQAFLRSIRQVLVGGEPLTPGLVTALFERISPDAEVVNLYGPTETTIWSTAERISRDGGKISIGRPLANTQLYVLDEQLRVVPTGQVGELFIGGHGVARGYWNRDELNEERFLPNPFREHGRMYKTGDLVRLLADGRVEYVGRADFQVKLRGYRIELGEIEAQLLTHPSVREASVFLQDMGDTHRLVACVTGGACQPAELREHLVTRLPDFMIPTLFLEVDRFPLTPNGKVDRKRLMQLALELSGDTTFVAPRTKTEQGVAKLFTDLLKMKRAGLAHHFFLCGGHSLLATRLVSHIRHQFHVRVSVLDIFQHPTVAELAQWIDQQEVEDRLAGQPLEREGQPMVSLLQEPLWLAEHWEPGQVENCLQQAFLIRGQLDVQPLTIALQEVIERHEVLRTTFHQSAGDLLPVVQPSVPVAISLEELSNETDAERQCGIEQWLAVGNDVFDLSKGPLFYVRLLKTSAQEQVLLVTAHAIVMDEPSLNLFVRELAQRYTAQTDASTERWAELPQQYLDFARWQRAEMAGERMQQQIAFWREQLSGQWPVLDLPNQRGRHSKGGATKSITALLPKTVQEATTALGRHAGATPFMTLLAAWNVFLQRLTGQHDLIVGTQVVLQEWPYSAAVIGAFSNLLLLRNDLSGVQSFHDALERTKAMAFTAYAHKEVPYLEIVRELKREQPGWAPLLQTMIVWETDTEHWETACLHVQPFEIGQSAHPQALTLSVCEREQGWQFKLSFDDELFAPSLIKQWLNSFQVMLTMAVENPDLPIARLPLMTEQERDLLFSEQQGRRSGYPKQSIAAVFEQQVLERPDAIALQQDDLQMTYAEVNGKANQLARYLRKHGVHVGDRVGVSLHRSPLLIVALLAIIKAGGGYVPLDPTYPEERLRFMYEDADLRVLLTESGLIDFLPEAVCLDLEAQDISNEASDNLNVNVSPDSLAYMYYTSGSTGQPKGVMNPHRGVVRLVKEVQYVDLSPAHTFLHVASISFDASTFEIWGCLLNGGRLVLYPPEQPTLHELGRLIRTCGVTTLLLTTGLFRQMVEHRLDDLRGVRQLLTGGDIASPSIVQKVIDELPDCRLINVYGPTESTTFTAVYTVPHGEAVGASVPIGPPIEQTDLYVLDHNLEPVPVGVAGELYIGGDGLALGYWNRPELTEERFIDHPFRPGRGETLYKSGDLVRWLPDRGVLEFVGRIDGQVKIRGFRIETGELEARLMQHDGVAQAVVHVREEVPGDKRLVAYFTSSWENPPSTSELANYLKQQVPDYMMPSVFVPIAEIPLTGNAKIDYKALPPPPQVPSEYVVNFVAPVTNVEKQLAQIWSEILGMERVSLADHFFERGGHSLLATQLLARIYRTFQLELTLSVLFEAPTLGALATCIQERLQAGVAARDVDFIRVERQEEYPLSYAQQRLWFIEQLDPGTPTYNVPLALRLKGELDVVALQRALQELFRRHDAFRTSFHARQGEPVQVIAQEVEVELPLVDLCGKQVEEEREALIQAASNADANRPFDLTVAPLVRLTLFALAEDDHVLYFCLHHIIYDGWSQSLLIREIATLYQAYVSGETSPLPEPQYQYVDYANWQRRWLEGEVIAQQLDYWKEQLKGPLPVLQLPTDRPRSESTGAGRRDTLPLSAELTEELKRLSQEEGVTLFMTLLAAFYVLLYRYTDQVDVLVGSPIANRTRVETEEMIGFFVNTIVLRGDLSNNPTFQELLQQVRQTTLGAYSNQDVPFEKLVELLQPERSLTHTPLFQVMFVLQNTASSEFRLSDERIVHPEVDRGTSIFDLSFDITEHGGQLYVTSEYNSDLFEISTMMRMLGHYRQLLCEMVAKPQRSISSYNMLSAEEEQELLYDFNNTERPFLRDRTVYQLFEEQVARHPDKIALRFQGQEVTYRELNAHANRIARFLHTQGLESEHLVGILMDRSPLMAACILAVWKAGGAYIPIDKEYPVARIVGILQDSSAFGLLTLSNLAAAELLEEHSCQVWLLDAPRVEADISEMENHDLNLPISTDALAYVIYTSGSTGKPKGAMVEHIGMMNHMMAKVHELQVTADSIVAQNASHCFDISVWQYFVALVCGGTTVIYDQELTMMPDHFINQVEADGVTILEVVPTVLSVILDLLAEAPRSLASLHFLVVTGETLKSNLVKKWFTLYPTVPLVNAYGPTEASDDITHLIMTEPPEMDTVPVGYPIQNFRIYIVDEQMQLCPVGVKGMICVAGVGVGRGYLNDPERTSQVFMDDPFAEEPGVRLYKTGDLGRWLPKGQIEFFGRKDYQVKIRGFRIELGEIENKLVDHPAVKEAVVIDLEDAGGNKLLCGYVVLREAIETQKLKAHLHQLLPDYMVPARFIVLEAMPLTSNGKIDRNGLPHPTDLLASTNEYVAPTNPLETRLIEIWQDVLGVQPIGLTANFFELGGHSLKATVLTSRMNKELQVQISLRDVFKRPTVQELAPFVAFAEQQVFDVIEPAERQAHYPLSSAQFRMLVLNEHDPHSLAYNVPDVILLNGTLDYERFATAVSELVARHEVLRTSFGWAEGEPRQIVHDTVRINVPVLETTEERLEQMISSCLQPFDLTRAPLVHVTLIRLGDDKQVMVFETHHIVTDGISSVVLQQDLLRLYQGEALEPLRLQYKDFAVWQQKRLESVKMREQEAFWMELLDGGLPVLALPTDFQRPDVQQFLGDTVVFQVPSDLAIALQAIARQTESTLFMLLLAAYNILLAKYANQEDILVGTPVAGRNHADVEEMVGMFVNTLVLRSHPTHDKSVRDFLEEVKQLVLRASEHQDFPFDLLVNKGLHKADPSRNPVFDAMIVLQNFSETVWQTDTLIGTPLEVPLQIAKFDITLFARETADGLEMMFEYSTSLFKRETIERMADVYLQVLSGFVQDRDVLIQDMEVAKYELLDVGVDEEIDFCF